MTNLTMVLESGVDEKTCCHLNTPIIVALSIIGCWAGNPFTCCRRRAPLPAWVASQSSFDAWQPKIRLTSDVYSLRISELTGPSIEFPVKMGDVWELADFVWSPVEKDRKELT